MIPLSAQLQFMKDLHAAMLRSDLRRVTNDQMAPEKAEERNDSMCSIITTLETQVLLEQVSEEMAAEYRSREEMPKFIPTKDGQLVDPEKLIKEDREANDEGSLA